MTPSCTKSAYPDFELFGVRSCFVTTCAKSGFVVRSQSSIVNAFVPGKPKRSPSEKSAVSRSSAVPVAARAPVAPRVSEPRDRALELLRHFIQDLRRRRRVVQTPVGERPVGEDRRRVARRCRATLDDGRCIEVGWAHHVCSAGVGHHPAPSVRRAAALPAERRAGDQTQKKRADAPGHSGPQPGSVGRRSGAARVERAVVYDGA